MFPTQFLTLSASFQFIRNYFLFLRWYLVNIASTFVYRQCFLPESLLSVIFNQSLFKMARGFLKSFWKFSVSLIICSLSFASNFAYYLKYILLFSNCCLSRLKENFHQVFCISFNELRKKINISRENKYITKSFHSYRNCFYLCHLFLFII